MYLTKASREDDKCLRGTIKAFQNWLKHTQKRDPTRSEHSLGLGALQSAIRGESGQETVPAELCAHLNLGRSTFEFSHEVVRLPIAQTVAFFEGQPLHFRVEIGGRLLCTIVDFVYRPAADLFVPMHQFRFLEEYCLESKTSGKKKKKPAEEKEEDSSVGTEQEAEEVEDEDESGVCMCPCTCCVEYVLSVLLCSFH
jgi:hypothetical protein